MLLVARAQLQDVSTFSDPLSHGAQQVTPCATRQGGGLQMQEEPEEETHVVRRVTVFEPKHVRIVPFRAGQVCSFVHLDHRLIQTCILSYLGNGDLYAVAQVCCTTTRLRCCRRGH
jgi:hypothetical protein